MTQFSITEASKAESTILLPMVHALAHHHGDTPRATKETLERDLSDGWLFGLIAHGPNTPSSTPLGYVLMMAHAQAQHGLRGMDLHHLFVHEHARGAGLGAALVGAAEVFAKARGASYMVVGAHAENHAAHQFYDQLGYDQKPASGQRFRKTLP